MDEIVLRSGIRVCWNLFGRSLNSEMKLSSSSSSDSIQLGSFCCFFGFCGVFGFSLLLDLLDWRLLDLGLGGFSDFLVGIGKVLIFAGFDDFDVEFDDFEVEFDDFEVELSFLVVVLMIFKGLVWFLEGVNLRGLV